MLHKVTHCTGRVSANTRPHQLRWGDREMGTAISCTEYSQVAGLIQETPRKHQLFVQLFFVQLSFIRRCCVAIVIVDRHMYVLSVHKRVLACARTHTEVLEVPEVLMANKAQGKQCVFKGCVCINVGQAWMNPCNQIEKCTISIKGTHTQIRIIPAIKMQDIVGVSLSNTSTQSSSYASTTSSVMYKGVSVMWLRHRWW